MSILSDARKIATKSTKAAKIKSKTAWVAGPVETTDPVDGKPMLVGLIDEAPYGLMEQYEGNFKPFRLGVDKAERVAVGHTLLGK